MTSNERHPDQLLIDFVTGQPTSFPGDGVITPSVRAACSALNTERTRAILAAPLLASSGEQIPADVWDDAFTRTAGALKVPFVSLEKMGFTREEEGWICSPEFQILKRGAEVEPYLHKDSRVVYKLFYLRGMGDVRALGRKISYERNEHGDYAVAIVDSNLKETMIKLQVLHQMGALCTEIVGLSDYGDYLIVKQPLATAQIYNRDELPYKDAFEAFIEDRKSAVDAIRGKIYSGQGLRDAVVVSWIDGAAWFISDLHHRNIMKDEFGAPTIIDALIGPIPLIAFGTLRDLNHAVEDARIWRETGICPIRKRWDEGFNEDEY